MVKILIQEQRKRILKKFWKTENAETVHTAWQEAFETSPLTQQTIFRNHFE